MLWYEIVLDQQYFASTSLIHCNLISKTNTMSKTNTIDRTTSNPNPNIITSDSIKLDSQNDIQKSIKLVRVKMLNHFLGTEILPIRMVISLECILNSLREDLRHLRHLADKGNPIETLDMMMSPLDMMMSPLDNHNHSNNNGDDGNMNSNNNGDDSNMNSNNNGNDGTNGGGDEGDGNATLIVFSDSNGTPQNNQSVQGGPGGSESDDANVDDIGPLHSTTNTTLGINGDNSNASQVTNKRTGKRKGKFTHIQSKRYEQSDLWAPQSNKYAGSSSRSSRLNGISPSCIN